MKTKAFFSYEVQKYLSAATMTLKRERDIAYLNYVKRRSSENKLITSRLNREVTNAIRRDTRNHLNNRIQKSGFWAGVSKLLPTKSTSKVLPPNFDISQLNEINSFYATMGAPPKD
jgi:hypothetical protein